MNYDQINKKLFELNFAKKSRLDLEDIQKLYELLDLKDYPKVHVAGTNGKGSCVQKLSSAFTLSGYRCGSFSSPHISTFRERIQVDGEIISKEDVEKIVPKLFKLAKENDLEVTFFEINTLLALQHFSNQEVDIAIIEVGLGGRLDATNCITPILSIITSIGLDHVQLLGDTLEKIAFEKAGIIKENVPVVTGPFANQKAIFEKARLMHSDLIKVGGTYLSYDDENQAIAKKALDFLKTKFTLNEQAIEKALKQKPACRLEKHTFLNRELILDMSHNEDGLRRLFLELSEIYQKNILVFTSMAFNHDYEKNLKIVSKYAKEIFILDIEHPRLADAKDLNLSCPKAKVCQLEEIPLLIEKSNPNDLILFTGSIFIMDAIYTLLGKKLEKDLFKINDGLFKDSALLNQK